MIVDLLRKLTTLDKDHFLTAHNGGVYFEATGVPWLRLSYRDGTLEAFNLGAVAFWCLDHLKKAWAALPTDREGFGILDSGVPTYRAIQSTLQVTGFMLTPEMILEAYANYLEAIKENRLMVNE